MLVEQTAAPTGAAPDQGLPVEENGERGQKGLWSGVQFRLRTWLYPEWSLSGLGFFATGGRALPHAAIPFCVRCLEAICFLKA